MEDSYGEADIVPEDMKSLRACLSCSLIKTEDQFLRNGCDSEYTAWQRSFQIPFSWRVEYQSKRAGTPMSLCLRRDSPGSL